MLQDAKDSLVPGRSNLLPNGRRFGTIFEAALHINSIVTTREVSA